jgi:hypothetical protein
MTPRQQRRLEQKLARRAEKKAQRSAHTAHREPEPACPPDTACPASENEPQAPVTTPISEAKLLANRANAQLSTGPVTQAGKAIVSQNATKHGLTGKFKVLPGESQSEFDQLLAGFLRSEAPVVDDEIEMVHQMAEALWLSRRSVSLQDACIVALQSGDPTQERKARQDLALYLRYQSTHDRAFFRFSAELRKRRNERARAQRGFVSQKYKDAAERRRQEMHETRHALQMTKQKAQEIRNRLAAARCEALELRNQAAKRTREAVPAPPVCAAAA